jgi:hypothetical protein
LAGHRANGQPEKNHTGQGEQEAVNKAMIRSNYGEMKRLYPPPSPAANPEPAAPPKQS